MKKQRQCLQQRKHRGSVAVEFALIMPIYFFLVVGMFHIGSWFKAQQDLHFAANKAARHYVYALGQTGTWSAPSDAEVITKITDYLGGSLPGACEDLILAETTTIATLTTGDYAMSASAGIRAPSVYISFRCRLKANSVPRVLSTIAPHSPSDASPSIFIETSVINSSMFVPYSLGDSNLPWGL